MPEEPPAAAVIAADFRPLRGAREPLAAMLDHVATRPDRLVELVDGSSEAVIAFTADRKIVHANRGAEALFGYAAGALAGESTDALVPDRLRQPNPPAMQPLVEMMQIELPGKRADGSELPVEWLLGSTVAGDRHVFAMVVRDHTATERAVESLRASEERFRLLVDGVQDYAIYLLDTRGRVSSWNRGAERNKGYTAAEVIGQSYAVFFTPEDRAAGLPEQQLARALAEGRFETTGWRVRKGGTRFRANASLAVLRTESGEHYGFAKITRDMTARFNAEQTERHLELERAAREAAEAAEQRRRESEERLRALQAITAELSKAVTPAEVAAAIIDHSVAMFGAVTARMYVVDADGGLDLIVQRGYDEQRYAHFVHLAADRAVPQIAVAHAREPVFYETRAALLEAHPTLAADVAGQDFEAVAVIPLIAQGELLGVFNLRFPEVRTFDAAARTLMMTVADLCAQAFARAKAFAAQLAARAVAESANRSKDEFLAMLGHELRNPLAPIVTALGILDQHATDATKRERMVIDRHVQHLVRLVDDLLDVSRITQQKVQLRRERVELATVVERALDLSSPLVEERGHHLAVDVPATGLCVFADPTRLAQIVTNLVNNAAKYTSPGGHIWVAARRDGDRVIVDVRDDGQGIDAAMMPHIFDLFAQESQAIDRARGGLGLGLAIVKNLTAMHDGTIGATSAGRGTGSTFTLALPLADSKQLDVPAAIAREPSPPSGAKTPPGARKVLVVDDNVDAAELMADLLRNDGHEVVTAHDGPAALVAARAFPPDVALLDIGLPVMDGYELARLLRAERQGIRLVALTGYGQADDRERARVAGFDQHMVKPVDLASLRRFIAA